MLRIQFFQFFKHKGIFFLSFFRIYIMREIRRSDDKNLFLKDLVGLIYFFCNFCRSQWILPEYADRDNFKWIR